MKTFIQETRIDPYSGKSFDLYFGGLTPAVFDIETTGLSPSRDKVILTGILLVSGGTAKAIQFFAESPDDEKEVIEKTAAALTQADFVITYNGKSFDLPFIKKRAEKLGAGPFPDIYDLDLYTVIRSYSDLGSLLNSLSQKSIEDYLGIPDKRSDRISGFQSIKHYEHYVTTGSFDDEKKIILHNRDDILQLYRLLPVLKNCDLHKAMYAFGYPAGRIRVDSCRLSASGRQSVSGLNVKAHATAEIMDYIAFPRADLPCRIIATSKTGLLEIDFPAERITDKIHVIDALKLINGAQSIILKSGSGSGAGSGHGTASGSGAGADIGTGSGSSTGSGSGAESGSGSGSGEGSGSGARADHGTASIGEDYFPLPPYPAYQSGYLILKQENKINCLEINTFLIHFLKMLEPALLIDNEGTN